MSSQKDKAPPLLVNSQYGRLSDLTLIRQIRERSAMETEQFSVARNNWRKIRTASDLYFVLRDDAKRLAEIGRADLSDKWMNRILQMPAAMDKEAINVVLLMACNELKRNGLIT